VVICPLSSLQIEIHNIFRRVVEAQESGALSNKRTGHFTFNNLLMQLRKVCNHPYLVLEDIQTIPDDLYDSHLIGSCGKLFVLEKVLSHLLASGSKVSITQLSLVQQNILFLFFRF